MSLVSLCDPWIHGTSEEISGKASGVASGLSALVGFANATAQYWTTPDASTGNFYSPAMKPGVYTQTLYQGELAVATRTVTVYSGTTTSGQNITSTWPAPSALWRIGSWDGTPAWFANSNRFLDMHPSDVRSVSWGPLTYTVGSSGLSGFPAYQWKTGANNPTTIKFNLTSSQIAARTVRIGITAAFAGGRPQITVNNWTSSIPAPSTQPDSRSMTIGTYRGDNTLYTYSVPASAFVTGTNTMTINVVSGLSGSTYLSPGFAYDAVNMY